jgi:hypothetical protein
MQWKVPRAPNAAYLKQANSVRVALMHLAENLETKQSRAPSPRRLPDHPALHNFVIQTPPSQTLR